MQLHFVIALVGGFTPTGNADELERLISVNHVATRWGNLKPPLRTYYIELKIRNPRPTPTWYIMRYSGDKALTTKPSFKMIDPWDNGYLISSSVKSIKEQNPSWFESLRVIADKNKEGSNAIEVFLIPARGDLHHSYFAIEAWAAIDTVEIWEASELLVNGETPLEAWLPYEIASTENTRITKEDIQHWEYKLLGSRLKTGKTWKGWPEGGIKYLAPKVIKKHLLPICQYSANSAR